MLEQVVRAHLAQQSAVAADVLAGLGAEPAPRHAYQRPSTSTIARIYARDRYHCRYCANKVILTPVMRMLALLHPELLPYHPNWKGRPDTSGVRRVLGHRRSRGATGRGR